jgi:hypothetical protein
VFHMDEWPTYRLIVHVAPCFSLRYGDDALIENAVTNERLGLDGSCAGEKIPPFRTHQLHCRNRERH